MDLKRWLPLDPGRWALGLLLALLLIILPVAAPVRAALPPGNAVTDPSAILHHRLPIERKAEA